MSVNLENLELLINHLKKVNPKNFNMRRWFKTDYSSFRHKSAGNLVSYMETGEGDCGTAGCIAGHAMLLEETQNQNKNSLTQLDFWGNAEFQARNWLGLTREQANYLFKPGTYKKDGNYVGYDIPRNISLEHTIHVLENLRDSALKGEPLVEWGSLDKFYDSDQYQEGSDCL